MPTSASGVIDVDGNEASGPADAIRRYDNAVDLLLAYDERLLDAVSELATLDEPVPMVDALLAYLSLMTTDVPDLEAARTSAAALHATRLNEREAAHSRAVDAWLGGRWTDAARELDGLLVRWPTDTLALVMGHLLDFFTGDAQNLRDRVARSLPSYDPAHPRTGFVLGLESFGFEESGHYEQARDLGLRALEQHPRDVWALHAVVHTYEMQGKVDEGITFMRSREGDWRSGNLFVVHNAWHLALYLLEAGMTDDALAIYDAEVHNDSSSGVAIEMLDASALLWRLSLDGVDTGDRYEQLADAWAAWIPDESWYVFNDVHAVVALCGAGRLDDARRVIERLQRSTTGAAIEPGTNRAMTAEVGLPASQAILAFTEGRYDDTVDALLPRRTLFHHFGGSHAQRDLLQRTLTEAAIRSGQYDLARALVDERLSLRDTSVYGLSARARLSVARGDTDAAAPLEERANQHRTRFATAAAAASPS